MGAAILVFIGCGAALRIEELRELLGAIRRHARPS
jgi:hypothetical protein